MVDKFSDAKRREIMSSIKSKNTKPEMIVRRLVHGLGYRYRLHVRSLPGTPDLVFSKRLKVIQIHGCFWHGHAGCRRASVPKTNAAFWKKKIAGNLERDRRASLELKALGFKCLVLWQCELKDVERLVARLKKFLGKAHRA